MRRIPITLLAILPLAACELGTDPPAVSLQDIPAPPQNHAALAVTAELRDTTGAVVLEPNFVYLLPLVEGGALPEVTYQSEIARLGLTLSSVTATGTQTTDGHSVRFRFTGPDGTVFEPRTTCRITIVSALAADATGRLTGYADCPVDAGEERLRVLVKFDHTRG